MYFYLHIHLLILVLLLCLAIWGITHLKTTLVACQNINAQCYRQNDNVAILKSLIYLLQLFWFKQREPKVSMNINNQKGHYAHYELVGVCLFVCLLEWRI